MPIYQGTELGSQIKPINSVLVFIIHFSISFYSFDGFTVKNRPPEYLKISYMWEEEGNQKKDCKDPAVI